MDRDYKENVYRAFFDELGSLQRDQLYKSASVMANIGRGVKAWGSLGVGKGLSNLRRAYRMGASGYTTAVGAGGKHIGVIPKPGKGGVLGGLREVARDPLSQSAMAAGTLAVAGGVGGRLSAGR